MGYVNLEVVSTPDIGSWHWSGWSPAWRWNSACVCMVLHCMQPGLKKMLVLRSETSFWSAGLIFISKEHDKIILKQWKCDNERLHDGAFHYHPSVVSITKTCVFKYIENFTSKKTENFQVTNSDIFHISAQNIDCGYSLEPPRRGGLPRRGSSNEYPQSMFLSRNKKNNVYPCKPQFYYIKVGFKGVKII